jgi:hypothetical protein
MVSGVGLIPFWVRIEPMGWPLVLSPLRFATILRAGKSCEASGGGEEHLGSGRLQQKHSVCSAVAQFPLARALLHHRPAADQEVSENP